ncbi:dienelactone hydrolase family protein [Amycolatopsis cynarae]|uniref:Dienelactone hydrolase family protein n=1 Tax=Amycolatopsis cynarae TaxID=2995223 RepID=A0ABY7AUU9_9PSEU|nr:dienelactone hydrolase family protein [Amycolatopsis sp. HUAS 11-8]WAL62979.1 dienelactone hydrolase family protein [Amycolatopsis sp. HUAS 11-8]
MGDSVRRFGMDDRPGVLLLHPWWGVTAAVVEWAESLAEAGRRVLVPDLYGGKIATTIEEAEAARDGMDTESALRLIGACADELTAAERPWTAMGFSLGADFACSLTARGQAGPDELILFYGGAPPRGEATRTRVVHLHVAPGDEYFPEEDLAATESGFRAAGAEVRTYRYNAGHWFAERDSPAFDAAAFALARTRVLDRLRAWLP